MTVHPGHSMLIRKDFIRKIFQEWDGHILYDWWIAVNAHLNHGLTCVDQPLNWHRPHERIGHCISSTGNTEHTSGRILPGTLASMASGITAGNNGWKPGSSFTDISAGKQPDSPPGPESPPEPTSDPKRPGQPVPALPDLHAA